MVGGAESFDRLRAILLPAGAACYRLGAYAFAATLATGLAYFVFLVPFQVNDNVSHILRVQKQGIPEILESELQPGTSTIRPLEKIVFNMVFEAAHGRYFEAFKAFHVAEIAALLVLLVRVMAVSTAVDLSAALVALMSVVGFHTFLPMVDQGYPINTYLTILVASAAAINLSFGRPSPWRDLAALALLGFALFTIETGVLVWVVLVAGFLAGFKGISARGVVACSAAFVSYFIYRFGVLEATARGLDGRSSGVGFGYLAEGAIRDLFHGRLEFFYLYNVASNVASLLFAEPRSGIWRFTRALVVRDGMTPGLLLGVAVMAASTLVIAVFIWRRRTRWRRREFGHHDRLVLVFLAVLLANAPISYAYLKDHYVSVAGLMYSLALFAALRLLIQEATRERQASRRIRAAVVIGALALGWTVRAAAVPYGLQLAAYANRQEWSAVDRWVVEQGFEFDGPQTELLHRLQTEALAMPVPDPRASGAWSRWGRMFFDRP